MKTSQFQIYCSGFEVTAVGREKYINLAYRYQMPLVREVFIS
jgi:hypothetical protein